MSGEQGRGSKVAAEVTRLLAAVERAPASLRRRLKRTFFFGLSAGAILAAEPSATRWILNPPDLETVLLGTPGEDGAYNLRATSDGGYIIAGCISRPGRGRDFAVHKLRADLKPDPDFAQAGRWVFGGSGDDQAIDVIEVIAANGLADGYLVAGYTDKADGDFMGRLGHGKIDVVLARLAPNGSLVATFGEKGVKLYGGSGDDEVLVHLHNYSEPGERLMQTGDGFIIAAMTRSSDGDLAGIATIGHAQSRDVMVFKIDAQGRYAADFADRGILRIGSKNPAGLKLREPNDFVFSIKPEAGGFVAAGYVLGAEIATANGIARAAGNEIEMHNPDRDSGGKHQMDGWVFRFDSRGRLRGEWAQQGFVFLGGSRQEKIYDVAPVADGYLVTGRTASTDLQFARPRKGPEDVDVALVKLGRDGALQRSFADDGRFFLGGDENDQGLRVLVDTEGILWIGQTTAPPPELAARMSRDFFRQIVVARLSPNGTWQRGWNLGGPGEDRVVGAALDRRGRIVIAGYRDLSVREDQDEKVGVNRDTMLMRFRPVGPRASIP